MLTMLLITLLFGLFLYQSHRLFSHHPKLTWIVFTTLPLLLLPWWIHHHAHTWFGWAKIYSVALGVIIIQMCRSPQIQNKRLPFLAAYFVLALNIAEATLNDFLAGGWAHYINGIAGILLIATITNTKTMGVQSQQGYTNFTWNLSVFWILGYTFWNINFVYMNFTELTIIHLAVLGSALAVVLDSPKLWFQARAFTLGTYLMIDFSDKALLRPIYSEGIFNENIALTSSLFCITWMLGFIIAKIWKTKHPTLLLHH